MFDDELLAEVAARDPVAAAFLQETGSLFATLNAELNGLNELGIDDRLMHALNAMIRFLLALGDARDKAGYKPGQAEIRNNILAWTKPTPEFETGHTRAMLTAAAYEMGIRFDSSGPNDSPMEAAFDATARREHLGGASPIDAVRKSIQRFRSKIRGTSVYRFDPATMTFQRFDAETVLLAGLPGKPGRPKR